MGQPLGSSHGIERGEIKTESRGRAGAMNSIGRLIGTLSVKRKLLLLTLLTSAVALFVSATVYTAYQLQALRHQTERQLSLLTDIVVEQSRLALRHGDSTALQSTLDALARDHLIEAAVVAGDDGRPVAMFSRDGIATDLAMPSATTITEAGSLASFRSVLADGETIGGVYLRGDSADLYSRLTREGLVGGGVMLLSFLSALLLSGRVRRTISEPIESMTAAARESRLQNGALALDTRPPDELGMLAAALSGLGERLRDHEREQEHQRGLHALRLEATGDALLEIDVDGRLHEINRGLQRLLGHTAEAIEGNSWRRYINPADATRADAWLQRAIQTGGGESCDLRMLDASGRWLPVRLHAQCAEAAQSSGRTLVTVSDRSESEELRESLHRLQERLNGLLACGKEALLELDAETRIISASEPAARLLGRPRSGLNGTAFADFAIDFDRADLHRRMDAAPAQAVTSMRTTLRRADGEVFPARVSWLRLAPDVGGFLMASMQDLGPIEAATRDLQAAREAAREAARARDSLVSNISHEVRNPVTAILAAGELLDRDLTGPGRERCLEVMRNSSDALLDVVDSLIDHSQLRSGTFAPDSISFEPRPILETILDVHAARASTKGVDLGLHVDAAVPLHLCGDPRRLRHVLLQLVGGAVRLTESGAVTVRAALDEPRDDHRVRLCVRVRGHGPGVARELRVCLTPGADGVVDNRALDGLSWSLGLTLAQTLTSRMGGELSVNELPGGQFEVGLRLPLDEVADSQQPTAVSASDIHAQRLLMLYADHDVAATLTANLADLGIEVVRADGPREALHLLHGAHADGEDFSLALVDSALPGKEARNLLQAIRSDTRLSATRLVLVQHLAGDDSAQVNADTVLVAPVRPSRLAANLSAPATSGHRQLPVVAVPPVSPAHAQSRARVLVADDDSGVQAALCFMLESLGYAADAVTNGSEVLTALARRDYDVVVLDCRMPVMDGFDTAIAIHDRHDATPVPVIAISGCLTPGDEERLRTAGVSAWLSKPIKEKSLLDAIESCVTVKRVH